MVVMKFGGTSVANANALRQVATIVQQRAQHHAGVVVVLSATAGTTSQLLELCQRSACGVDITEDLRALEKRHIDIAHSLGVDDAVVHDLLLQCKDHLEAARVLMECTPQTLDAVAGFGELLSTKLFAAYLATCDLPVIWKDVRSCIVTDDTFTCAQVDELATQQATNANLLEHLEQGSIVVTQGFIGATHTKIPTTLGRGGSDYSASILGSCLQASEIQIWTDVSGVYTCDPRITPEAVPLESISFDDVRTLALYGAKVLHPETVAPAITAGIPVRVLNTFAPDAPGTVIQAHDFSSRAITALSMIRPCRRIHTDDEGLRALTSIEAIHDNIAQSVVTRNGHSIIIHEHHTSIATAIDIAAVGHEFSQDNVACIAICGSHVIEGSVVALIADRIGKYPSTTVTSLVHPQCVLIATPLEISSEVCNDLHSLLLSSGSF